jgi:hypothetical protein
MWVWGVEDVDFGLKCWLVSYSMVPFRARHELTIFQKAWDLFGLRRASAERERDYLAANRQCDLSWYVETFSINTGDWFVGAV